MFQAFRKFFEFETPASLSFQILFSRMNMTQGITFWWPWKVGLSAAMLLYAVWCWINGPVAPVFFRVPFADQVLLAAGAVIHLWHFLILKHSSPRVGEPTRLVTDRGLFRLMRHPMYFGDLVMVLGASLAAGDALALAGLIGFTGIAWRLSRDEDVLMARRFGEEFTQWKQKTRLFIPGVF